MYHFTSLLQDSRSLYTNPRAFIQVLTINPKFIVLKFQDFSYTLFIKFHLSG